MNLPNKGPEFLLVACDIASEILFHAPHGGNGILKSLFP